MKLIKPIIKFNGGDPVAVCNECSTIICYVRFIDKNYVVSRQYIENIDDSVGNKAPTHCEKCLPQRGIKIIKK